MIIKGLKINYKTLGEGRPLLILHGWGSRSDNWQKVGELLANNGVKVIIPDLPGFGQSDKPQTSWNLDEYCDFVEEFVKNLGLERFSLSGHSFGGALAVKCGLKFPEKIDKLFLVGAACFRRKAFRKKLFYIIAKIFKVFSFLPFYSSIRKAFYKFIVRKSDYSYADGIMKDVYLKIIKQDLLDVLSRIQISTIIIWGEKDKIKKIKEARLIKEKIQNSKLEIISDVGHSPHLETPGKLAEIISENL